MDFSPIFLNNQLLKYAMIRGFIALIVILAFLPVAMADSYELSIRADNTAVVTAIIEGSGLHSLELPKDAVPEVKGALYLKKGNVLELSIGSTEKATVTYETKGYTKNSTLVFYPNNASIKVILPKDAELKSVSPAADFNKNNTVEWMSEERIEVTYALKSSSVPEKSGRQAFVFFAYAAAPFIVLFILVGLLYVLLR